MNSSVIQDFNGNGNAQFSTLENGKQVTKNYKIKDGNYYLVSSQAQPIQDMTNNGYNICNNMGCRSMTPVEKQQFN